jgi:hypothetical protein
MMQITCRCGAVYEVIETEDKLMNQHNPECVLCHGELLWSGFRTPQFRLVKHPDRDRG